MELVRPLDLSDEIRLGSRFDGGYLVPLRAVHASSHLISLGYGHDFNFERAFLNFSRNKSCELYESTISLATLVNGLVNSLYSVVRGRRSFPLFKFKILINYFFLRLMPRLRYFKLEVRRVSVLNSQISFSEITSKCKSIEQTMVKIDIEGAEYELVSDLFGNNFSAIISEFHYCKEKFNEFNAIIESSKRNYVISHVHINNFAEIKEGIPDTVEITFLNRTLIRDEEFSKWKLILPTLLDRPCNPNSSDVIFLY